MRLSSFISENQEEILRAWDKFARGLRPASDGMTDIALRNMARQILQDIIVDLNTDQSAEQQYRKSLGLAEQQTVVSAATSHGSQREASQFTIAQLTAEYRALRATVLRLWLPHMPATADGVQELVRFNEAIDQAVAESVASFSARSDRARDMLLAVLCHDFRAPLATMAASAQVLTHPMLALNQVNTVGARVRRMTSIMTSVVDDLADYARAQLGTGVPIARQHLDLAEVCAWAVDSAGAVYPRAKYDFRAPDDGPLAGMFDGVRLHRMLTNLLLNAAQHGSTSHPVRMEARSDGEVATVSVCNQGPVIEKAKIKDIFKPLVKLQPRSGSEGTSMGLGLYIAREIAEAHGGSIEVTSTEAATTFTAVIPCGACDAHPSESRPLRERGI